MSATTSDGELAATFRGLWARLLQGLQHRFDLVALELRQERERAFGLLLGAVVAAFSAFLAFLCLNVALVLLFWDRRVEVTLGLFGVYAVVALVLGLAVRRRARRAPAPFAATLEELKKDRACLGPDR